MKNLFFKVGIPFICAVPVTGAAVMTAIDIPPQAKDIETDSWETFCYYSSRGEKAFKQAYHIDDINSLIGDWNTKTRNIDTLEREVKLADGTTTKVRLIGINHDNITGKEGSKALFTFEFVDCLTQYVTYGLDPFNITWEESTLRDYCLRVIDELPSDLKSHILAVDKQTWDYDEDSEDPIDDGQMVTTTEKLFPLSYIEVAGEEELEDPMKPFEGEMYDLYQKALYSTPYYRQDHESSRKKSLINDEFRACNYWLRSPYCVWMHGYDDWKIAGAYCVQSITDGASTGEVAVYLKDPEEVPYFAVKGVAPAFCV